MDKGVVSIDWLTLFPDAKLFNHNLSSSDHCQVSLSFKVRQCRKAPPFKFIKLWTTRKDFDCLVKKTWCTHFQGSFMYYLTKKCRLLKERAKNWSTTRFGNIFRQLRTVEARLKIIQSELILREECPHLISLRNKFLLKQAKLLHF